jgi:hypothetical protein
MYDAKAGSELAARYSDTKEAVHEAIALAPRLKLTRQTKRLKKRLVEFPADEPLEALENAAWAGLGHGAQ